MKRAICLLAALMLVILPVMSSAECEHQVELSEWVLIGYVDPQPGVPGYSGDYRCPICGTIMKKGEPIDALPQRDEKEEKGTEQDEPVPVPIPVDIGSGAPESPAAHVSAPASQDPERKTEREHFSELFPYRRVQMDPEPGIVAPAAGELIWSPDMETEGESKLFSFRNGITFGMTKEEIIRKEAENGEIKEDEWTTDEINNWQSLASTKNVQVSEYKTPIIYILANGQLQIAGYDITDDDADKIYSDLSSALTSIYGQGEPGSPVEVADIINSVSPDSYTDTTARSVLAWKLENVVIYQYYYAGNRIMILYTDPAFDYSKVNEPKPANTTGL